MRLQWKLKLKSSEARLQEIEQENTKKWMVWWYHGIYKNRKAESQPKVSVAFRVLSEEGFLSDDFTVRTFPLQYLGQLRIGTVWLKGRLLQEAIIDDYVFDIDFNKVGWKITSLYDTSENNTPSYPVDIHPIQYPKDKNKLIEFKIKDEGRLIVPCTEFFTRCYGRSGELRRILTTYPWENILNSAEDRLFAPIDGSEEPGVWKVKLTKKLVNGDVIFLAHAKYDKYTETRAKEIYSKIYGNNTSKNDPIFLEVTPWFKGEAKLKAKGIWFDEGKSFLELQIVGCSDPGGVLIERDRENAAKGGDESGLDIVDGAGDELVRVKPQRPEIIDLTGDLEPDRGSATVDVYDSDFEVLGEPRRVVDRKTYEKRSSTTTKMAFGDANDCQLYSAGENHGKGKGVGYASIYAKSVLESQGVLLDMWNALLLVQKKNPSVINSVEWFTFKDGFQKSEEPQLVTMSKFSEAEQKKIVHKKDYKKIIKWPYLNSKKQSDIRGLLAVRLTVYRKYIYLFEIQRRPQLTKDNNGVTKESETFQGFIFNIEDDSKFEGYLREFLSEVREVKGVVSHLVKKCPGKAYSFKHSTSSTHPCELAVVNALSKMKIFV